MKIIDTHLKCNFASVEAKLIHLNGHAYYVHKYRHELRTEKLQFRQLKYTDTQDYCTDGILKEYHETENVVRSFDKPVIFVSR